MKPGRVVIVEDSPTIVAFLKQLVEESGFEVVGTALNGVSGETLIRETRPTLVLSDIRMPGGDGIEMTSRVMRTYPVPIILITAYDPTNPDLVFRAMEAGALEVLPKPPARHDPEFDKYQKRFARTLRILSGLPVVRRFEPSAHGLPSPPVTPALLADRHAPVIAIGASTGGPTLVAALLTALQPKSFSFAVVAQHMVPEFMPSFSDWLRSIISLPVQIAKQGERPESGVVYLAPPNFHLRYAQDGRWKLLPGSTTKSPHVPSIDVLFESLTRIKQQKVIGILLTGMGTDGAAGLKKLKEAGAWTIVQEPSTAVVSSMPQAAIRQNAAGYILTPSEIEHWLSGKEK